MVEQIIGVFLELIGIVLVVIIVIGLFLKVAGLIKDLRNPLIMLHIFYKVDKFCPQEHLIFVDIRPALMLVPLVKYNSCKSGN
jgi:hypothetical protein